MSKKQSGRLIIIGGKEEKKSDPVILRQVAEDVKRLKAPLVITTVASELPDELFADYSAVFCDLGVTDIQLVDIRERAEAYEPEAQQMIEKAAAVFFTGGDQQKITGRLGGSPLCDRMKELYARGGTIVGTSAGAAVMPETMLVSGAGDESSLMDTITMAPGLGLIHDVIIDSHFAERGRMGRLLGAVAHNPRNLGLGIDENTAIIVENDRRFRVIGAGAVYAVDGRSITYSSFAQQHVEGVIRLFDAKVHVLGADDCFDLIELRPYPSTQSAAS
jgi:cyanophycinase